MALAEAAPLDFRRKTFATAGRENDTQIKPHASKG
jgi:hypothetical protein